MLEPSGSAPAILTWERCLVTLTFKSGIDVIRDFDSFKKMKNFGDQLAHPDLKIETIKQLFEKNVSKQIGYELEDEGHVQITANFYGEHPAIVFDKSTVMKVKGVVSITFKTDQPNEVRGFYKYHCDLSQHYKPDEPAINSVSRCALGLHPILWNGEDDKLAVAENELRQTPSAMVFDSFGTEEYR